MRIGDHNMAIASGVPAAVGVLRVVVVRAVEVRAEGVLVVEAMGQVSVVVMAAAQMVVVQMAGRMVAAT